MLDKHKHFIGKTLQLLAICIILCFYQFGLKLKRVTVQAAYYESEAVQVKKQLSNLTEQLGQIKAELGAGGETADAVAAGIYQDGVYCGEGVGFGGSIQVEVTITDGAIAGVNIVSADGEDSAYLDMAKGVLDEIISAQTAEVDTISGATFSSGGIREAVKQALTEAE